MGEALDTHQAAARAGLAPGTMRKLRIRGEGPRFLKLGRAVRYRSADLDEWLSGRIVTSTSQQATA